MDIALLLLIACALGGGVAGGLLSAWGCHRRVLALEETFKLVMTSYEDRINQLTKIVVRQDKSEAAKVRWVKADKQLEEIRQLATQPPQVGHPWDPRTWGNGNG